MCTHERMYVFVGVFKWFLGTVVVHSLTQLFLFYIWMLQWKENQKEVSSNLFLGLNKNHHGSIKWECI